LQIKNPELEKMSVFKDPILEKDTVKTQTTAWHVIYTKAKHEKKVAQLLASKGLEAYCPIKIEQKVWSDRIKKIETPIFRSYCFVKVSQSNYIEVLETPGVVRYLYWCGSPAIVPDIEMAEIKNWIEKNIDKEFHLQQFKQDEIVQIQSGILKNRNAQIVKQNGNSLILQINSLGLRVICSLEETILSKI
jgi:transcriptional antiterminator RfaH